MRAQFGADDSRMSVIPCPLHKRFTRSSAAEIENFRARYQLPLNFWLYVAHMYPHKNHLRLLMAYQKLKADGQMPWKLVLRGNDKGSHREISEAIAQHGLKQDVLFLPELPDDELPRLYSAASALVFPSLHEGLGIPLLEAMACGCPITASEIPAVRETTQDAAVYFDPLNIDNVAETMRQVQSRDDLRARSHKLGLDRAEAFRAPKIVSKLLAAYSCVSRKSPT
jgi:glycosyltransferase involved in cell wall biosynthesis